ncbi:MAG: ABC transporter transmembrane domain-containing protein, partial [Bryobacteraceae bacterium]
MKEVFAFCRPYLARYAGKISLGTCALVAKDLAGAGVPLLIKLAVDSLTAGAALSRVAWLAAAVAALSLIKGVFMYWMRVILVGVSRDVEYDMRNDLFAHLVKLDGGFFARYRTGDIMARATNDLNAVRMMLGPALMYLAETSLTLVLALAVMLAVDWQLTLWALAPAPLVSLAVMFFGKRIHDRFEAIQKLYSDISSRVNESLSGIRVIRAYVQEEAEMQRFQQLNEHYIGENLRLARLSGMFLPSLFFFIGLTFLIVLWAGSLRMLDGRLTLGSFVMFNS